MVKRLSVGQYLFRLVWVGLLLAAWVTGGIFAEVYGWRYIIHARDTWDYFPRGMYTIPIGLTIVWLVGAGSLLVGWFRCFATFEDDEPVDNLWLFSENDADKAYAVEREKSEVCPACRVTVLGPNRMHVERNTNGTVNVVCDSEECGYVLDANQEREYLRYH